MMERISDEIRKWCADLDSDDVLCTTATLYTLADRIDSEMAALPKTADGVPVHVGDTAYTYDEDGFEIVEINIDKDKPRIVCSTGSGLDVMRLPSSVFHTRPDSWNRIADELEEWSEDNRVNGDSEVFNRAADYADRIRKLAEKERVARCSHSCMSQ